MEKWKNRGMQQVSSDKGKELWKKELKRLSKKRKICGHGRWKKARRCPLLQRPLKYKQKCLHQWGTTRFVVLTGCFTGLLDRLDEYKLPWQHVKMRVDHKCEDTEYKGVWKTIDTSTYAGMYIGYENYDRSPLDVFNTIKSIASSG